MQEKNSDNQPIYLILLLIIAGEAIFILPFVIARVFRPTFLDSFEINNFQLGSCFSIYGIVALLSYLFGGPMADRFKPRVLMSIALILTALGGFYMATFPSYENLKILFGYWGFTTIFLFWAAMIKTTRIWGGEKHQGIAYGLLDGGRGLVGALFGLLGVLIFSSLLSGNSELITLVEKREILASIIISSSVIVIIIAVIVFLVLKPRYEKDDFLSSIPPRKTLSNVVEILKIPAVWFLMIIIVCAYVAYKITDVFSLYANEVMLFDELDSAKIGSFLLFIRPITGISIGLLADRSKTSLWMIVGFLLISSGALVFASGTMQNSYFMLFFLNIIIIAVGIYAIRALYFAALEEAKIPLAITGTAVGLISLVGYTPDIFAGPMMGYLLDNSPGPTGHQHVFVMLFVFAFTGLITAIAFKKTTSKT